jgi:hypothetical protein
VTERRWIQHGFHKVSTSLTRLITFLFECILEHWMWCSRAQKQNTYGEKQQVCSCLLVAPMGGKVTSCGFSACWISWKRAWLLYSASRCCVYLGLGRHMAGTSCRHTSMLLYQYLAAPAA